jgi:hypothetical protein
MTFNDPNDPGIIQVDPEWLKFVVIKGEASELVEIPFLVPGVLAIRLEVPFIDRVEVCTTHPADHVSWVVWEATCHRILLDLLD